MPTLDDILQQKIDLLAAKGQKRTLNTSARGEAGQITRTNKGLISFSCNDYLGLSRHPEVVEAAGNALRQYGAGAGASRLVTGNHPLYEQLEAALADDDLKTSLAQGKVAL